MENFDLAILGMGNAGKAFAGHLLAKGDMLAERYGLRARVTAIATATRGTLIDPDGIDLSGILSELGSDGRFSPGRRGLVSWPAARVVAEAPYDALVELTPLDVATGRPAIDYLEAAFARGKHAISANKGPLAHAAGRLKSLAAARGVSYLHETAVMDGAPVFNLVRETLPLCRVTGIRGILNTTTNFLLCEMARGVPYAEALEEGRRRGFVESDPSLDVDGWDASAKLVALLNALAGADLRPSDVDRTGIGGIGPSDLAAAASRGETIRLVCSGGFSGSGFWAKVAPESIPLSHPYASITGTSSVVTIETDLMGAISVIEHDPEIGQTGYGVLSDLATLLGRVSGR